MEPHTTPLLRRLSGLILVLLDTVSSLYSQELTSTKGVALVVGNSAYVKVKTLANSGNDAADMGAVLKELGWDVTVVKGASLKAFRNAVQAFGKKLVGQKAGLFYYAGHGLQSSGVNYLVPVAAEIELESDYPVATISADYVMSAMDEAKVPLKLLILDACRDNPFAKVRSTGTSRGLGVVQTAATGTIFVYATAPGDVSQDGSTRNGVFTEAFLSQLRTPGIDFQEIFDRTAQLVSLKTGGQQNPWMNKSFYGKLYLNSPADAQKQTEAKLEALKKLNEQETAKLGALDAAVGKARSRAEKDPLALEQQTAQAKIAAPKEEQSALERTKALVEARAAEEAKNKGAANQRAADAEAQLARLRQQVEARRQVADAQSHVDDSVVVMSQIKALDASIADIQKQFDEALARRVAETESAFSNRAALIGTYEEEPWRVPPNSRIVRPRRSALPPEITTTR